MKTPLIDVGQWLKWNTLGNASYQFRIQCMFVFVSLRDNYPALNTSNVGF